MIEKLKIGDRSLPRKAAVIAAKVNEIIDEGGGSDTPAQIKQKYESNENTNAFTDAAKTKSELPFGLLDGEIGETANFSIDTDNYTDYLGKVINCHPSSNITVTLANVQSDIYSDKNLYWFTNSGTANVTIESASVANRPFVGGGGSVSISPGESVAIKGVNDAGSQFVEVTSNKAGAASAGRPFASGVCITLSDGSEINSVQSIDQLTDVPLTLRFNATNTEQLVGGVTLLARRSGAQENISSFTGITNGINERTITLSAADITGLRAGTGALRFNVIGNNIELEGVCIAVEPEPLVNITDVRILVSAEYYAAQSPPSQSNLLIYEDLNAAETEMSSNGSITLQETAVPVSFYVRVGGMVTSISAASGVTLNSNFDNPTDGDLLLIVGKASIFDAYRVSNIHDTVSFLDVRYHSLDAGFAGVPTTQTEEVITVVNNNLDPKSYILTIQGITVGAFPNVARGVSALKYTVTQAQWSQIAGTTTGDTMNYNITNGDDARLEYLSLFRVDL